MRCMGEFKDDRMCSLCEKTLKEEYIQCKKIYDERLALNQKLRGIERKCPHRDEEWDEYDKFYSCNKNGNGYGRHADECKCTLECEKYVKGE